MKRESVALQAALLTAMLAASGVASAGKLGTEEYSPKAVIDLSVTGDINPGRQGTETWSASLLAGSDTATDSSGRPLNASFSIDPATGDVALSGSAIVDGKWFWTAVPMVDVGGGELKPAFEIELSRVEGNVDPFLTYSFRAGNNGATPLTFTFAQGLSLIPTVSPDTEVRASLGYSLVDGTGGLTIAPMGGNPAVAMFELSSNNGVTFVAAGPDVQLGDSKSAGAGGSAAYSFGGPTWYPGEAGTFNYMRGRTEFTLTGGRDVAVLTGRVEVIPIPEPSTYALLGLGIGMVGFALRRSPRKITFG
jgi:PEP-CTERM motif